MNTKERRLAAELAARIGAHKAMIQLLGADDCQRLARDPGAMSALLSVGVDAARSGTRWRDLTANDREAVGSRLALAAPWLDPLASWDVTARTWGRSLAAWGKCQPEPEEWTPTRS